MADGVEAASPVHHRWHVGSGVDACCRCRPTPPVRSTGGCRWTPPIARVHQHAATLARSRGQAVPTQGARSNDKNPRSRRDEPDDHAIGRSRGGLTTKAHALVDGRGLPLVLAVTPGQAATPRPCRHCSPSYGAAPGPGRPRPHRRRPRDKAYSSRGTAPTCAPAASKPSSPNRRPERPPPPPRLARRRPRASTPRLQAAQRHRALVQPPSSGADWPPATTNSPSSTAAGSSCGDHPLALMTSNTP